MQRVLLARSLATEAPILVEETVLEKSSVSGEESGSDETERLRKWLEQVDPEAAQLRPELIFSVRSLGAGRRALFRYVYLPASLPATLTALRVTTGTAIAVLFIAEQSLTRYGLGYYIVVETYQVLRYPEMYAGILAMSLLGLLLRPAPCQRLEVYVLQLGGHLLHYIPLPPLLQ